MPCWLTIPIKACSIPDPYHSPMRKAKSELHRSDFGDESWHRSAMPTLYLVIAVLCMLFPDRAAVVCGVLMLTAWWRRQR
jgi:hypothetical protein